MEQWREQMGTCRFCRQDMLISAEPGTEQDELDRLATDACNCTGAVLYQKKQRRKQAAYEYIRKSFAGRESMINLFKGAVDIVFEEEIDGVTIRQQEYTWKIRRNKDGYIEITSEYKKSNTEEF